MAGSPWQSFACRGSHAERHGKYKYVKYCSLIPSISSLTLQLTGLDMTRGVESLAVKYLAFTQALAVSQLIK